jgi:hypothetical protein
MVAYTNSVLPVYVGSSTGEVVGVRLGGARVLTLLIHVALHSGVFLGQVFANIIH